MWRKNDLQTEQTERSTTANQSGWLALKRGVDVLLAASALIVLSPIMAIVAISIPLSDRGPLFFSHERIGRNGRKFNCLKFRTMCVNGDAILRKHLNDNLDAGREWAATQKLKCDPRVFPFGRTLRETSLDELPQLINILRGEMSIVGPRPVTDSELMRYGEGRSDYLSVRPGLTGLWQISGRNDVSYDERVSLDLRYIHNWSMFLDFRIVIATVRVVFFQKGSY